MTVHFSPNYVNNPYQRLLQDALQPLGVGVDTTGDIGRADVLHIHWQERWLGREIDHPCKVWTCHNLFPHGTNDTRLLGRFVKQLQGVIVHNQYSRRFLKKQFGIDSTLIAHPHFIDQYPRSMTRQEARKLFGYTNEHKVLLHLGALKPYKQIFKLVEQFSELEGPEWQLLIAGYPHRIDQQRLINLCASDDRIKLYDSFVPKADMARYLLAADAMLLGYEHITTSGSAVLGMSYDLPIIAPDLPPLREQVKAVAFYDKHIKEALELWHLLGSGNQDYISQFGWEKAALRTFRVYQKALGVENRSRVRHASYGQQPGGQGTRS